MQDSSSNSLAKLSNIAQIDTNISNNCPQWPNFLPRINNRPPHWINPHLFNSNTSSLENFENWRQMSLNSNHANNINPQFLALCSNEYNSAPRRKNATRETTSILKAWLNQHKKNPYPTKGEKIMLALITKMTLTQVSTWFANARRRLKKENKMTWSSRNRHSDSVGCDELLDEEEEDDDVVEDDDDDDDEGGGEAVDIEENNREDMGEHLLDDNKARSLQHLKSEGNSNKSPNKIWSIAELATSNEYKSQTVTKQQSNSLLSHSHNLFQCFNSSQFNPLNHNNNSHIHSQIRFPNLPTNPNFPFVNPHHLFSQHHQNFYRHLLKTLKSTSLNMPAYNLNECLMSIKPPSNPLNSSPVNLSSDKSLSIQISSASE